MASPDPALLPYEEPSISTILILSSFLLLLNAINHVFDKLILCGLVGQVLLGIIWGTPVAHFLGMEAERFIVNLGYLGLILLVYEGGLSTSFQSLKANICLSIAVALTGISLPIALSFVLLQLVNATPIQAFAAGAALCSTSLGTTFAVLKTSGLVKTKMGVILSTAAMMDDVVGLVMVQVIANLGDTTSRSFSAVIVVRPVLVSLAFAVLTPVCANLIVRPATKWLNNWRELHPTSKVTGLVKSQSFVVTIHTLVLVAMVVGSSYAGTSNLFAAYLAGATTSWWDTELAHPLRPPSSPSSPPLQTLNVNVHTSRETTRMLGYTRQSISGIEMFENYYGQALTRILKPFFFASIGFTIPIREMFNVQVVWRGFIYALLMFMGKLACGIWLLKLSAPNSWGAKAWISGALMICHNKKSEKMKEKSNHGGPSHPQHQSKESFELMVSNASKEQRDISIAQSPQRSNEGRKMRNSMLDSTSRPELFFQHGSGSSIRKPISVYPSLILGSAMTARGEIGFLISSLAQSTGIFFSSPPLQIVGVNQDNTSIFLVVTWAVMLCTIIGPILVGVLVRRVKAKERMAASNPQISTKNVLGDWGVQ